tara:strand:- start:190 stop:516 length:327 start_codon:yes stop_codon:yes gene_type:complete
MSLPTEANVSAALRSLTETDVEYGQLIARVKALEHQAKTIKALVFLEAIGTVAEREAKANSSGTFRAFVEDYQNAVADREIMGAKRKTHELVIDVWRSCNANRRQGNI